MSNVVSQSAEGRLPAPNRVDWGQRTGQASALVCAVCGNACRGRRVAWEWGFWGSKSNPHLAGKRYGREPCRDTRLVTELDPGARRFRGRSGARMQGAGRVIRTTRAYLRRSVALFIVAVLLCSLVRSCLPPPPAGVGLPLAAMRR